MHIAELGDMKPSWMLARLERETRLRQATADNDRLSLMSGPASLDAYACFLVRVYGFEAPVESALYMTEGLDAAIDIHARIKMTRLESDLQALGLNDPSQLRRCRALVPFRDAFDALGWIYVLERNALLHGILRRHLEERLRVPLGCASAYLRAHELAMGARMRELGQALDRVARSPEVADRIVGAAHVAFRYQHHWYADAARATARVA